MRFLEADPGDQNLADPCGCGSATLPTSTIPKGTEKTKCSIDIQGSFSQDF
jgi:hypothetical protein